MSGCDLHIHTVFSDGMNTPEEVVLAAIARGMETVGISDHSYTFFDESYCIKKDDTVQYRTEIERLKEKYSGRIKVLCGIEQDFYSDAPTDGYDYVIGSVHYIKCGEEYVPVDETAEILTDAAKRHFGGDMYALADEYYKTVGRVYEKTGADIIGHFDLITKFIEHTPLFDAADERYRAAWRSAADKLLGSGAVFEINTGAISRGYRTSPYPSEEIRAYLKDRGAKFILSSDAHSSDKICFMFESVL